MSDTPKQRIIETLRYWRQHNTFAMGAHDLNVLRLAADLLDGRAITGDVPVPPPR